MSFWISQAFAQWQTDEVQRGLDWYIGGRIPKVLFWVGFGVGGFAVAVGALINWLTSKTKTYGDIQGIFDEEEVDLRRLTEPGKPPETQAKAWNDIQVVKRIRDKMLK